MLLAFDVGNSNTKIALCPPDGEGISTAWRISTDRARTPDEWQAVLATLLGGAGYSLSDVSAAAIASVVPPATRWLAQSFRERRSVEPVILTSDRDFGIRVATDVPAETGIDRVVNALAAYRRTGGPVVVVDCGTATKFDAVDAGGTFFGGAIGPGLQVAFDTLASRAARLYAVDLVPPPRAIGTNTIASVQSGVVLGYLAFCQGMIARVLAELGPAPVLATGGAGALVAAHLDEVSAYLPELTIEGVIAAFRHLSGG